MKKGCFTAALALLLALLTLLAAAPAVNDRAAKKVAKDLEALPLPADTVQLETVYRAGKLAGNGNGMQYFGGMLLESGLPLEELRDYYAGFPDRAYTVEPQRGQEIALVEHGTLAFETKVTGDRFFLVYDWGTNDTIFHELDLRGH